MAAKAFNLAAYGKLLTDVHPRVPHAAAENEALIAQVHLFQQNEQPTPEERAFTELLLTLIEKFEDAHYSTKRARPEETLRELMRARGLQPKDMYAIFGSKGTTSEVLRGKRGISKGAAKALAEFFGVSAELFL